MPDDVGPYHGVKRNEFVALNIQPRKRGEPVIQGGHVLGLLLKRNDVVDLRPRIGAVMAWIYPPTASFTKHDQVFWRDNSFQNCSLLDSNPSRVWLH